MTPLLPQHAHQLRQWTLIAPDGSSLGELSVPSAWEDYGVPRTAEGPFDYVCTLNLAPTPNRRYWLYCEAVSYEATGYLNGALLGTHRGIWDSFAWELTPHLKVGTNELRLRVVKHGGARYPVPQVLSGFLPYVASTFGGLWQPVHLFETGQAWLADLWVRGEADGTVSVEGAVGGATPAEVHLRVFAPDDVLQYEARFVAQARWRHEFRLPAPYYCWHPRTPHLYRLHAEVWHNGILSHSTAVDFGLRTVAVDGSTILLNGEPVYPRGILHWGWYIDTHAPNPSQAVAARELRAVLQAGFNMLKACLWVPSREYLRLCDKMGVAVWLELPLWLPQMDESQITQVKREYEAIVRQVRNHPSILLWTLGCELSARFPIAALGELYTLVKQLTGSPLVRDNSGGGECYGGSLQEHADFADYHLYGDAHYARTTFKAFLEMPRPPAPWLQGEFADHDTMRDFVTLRHSVPQRHLWWLERDPEVNPQGVRWFYETPFVEERLAQAGLLNALPELVRTSRLEMYTYHKLVLETMRSLAGTSGYVLTGLKDTPITTAGILDERGEPKVSLEAYTAFNADTVLLLDWHRRRAWIAGGDRPANPDPFNHFGGQVVYPRVVASHFGTPLQASCLRWQLQWDTGEVISAGEVPLQQPIASGVQFLAQLEVALPSVEAPRRATFAAELWADSGVCLAANTWQWGIYPRPDWLQLGTVGLHDPAEQLWGLPREPFTHSEHAQVWLTTHLSEAVLTAVRSGGAALWVLTAPEPALGCERVPFWREAVHRFLPHTLWRYLPRPAYLNATLFAFSTDVACRATTLLESPIQPIWQRVDTRTGYTHWYLGEARIGAGTLLITTLHFAGYQGDTPLTLTYHPAGHYWLWAMLCYLIRR